MDTRAYVFEQARDVIELLQHLGRGPDEVSLLMTDRTAEREFSLEARAGSDIPLPLNEGGERLARALHPLAALGGPGSGLVGVGAGLEYLHGVGLGSYRDLPTTLAACSVSVAVPRRSRCSEEGVGGKIDGAHVGLPPVDPQTIGDGGGERDAFCIEHHRFQPVRAR